MSIFVHLSYETACAGAEADKMLQGTIEGHEHSYTLDEGHTFEVNRPILVCGNIAAMLGEGGISHLGKHFQVSLLVLTLIDSSLVRKLATQQIGTSDEKGLSALLSIVMCTHADL